MPNQIIVASAGSGKTTTVVEDACADRSKRVALITYTKNGRDEIYRKTFGEYGCIPPNVIIDTWFSFLLKHFVRPYQRSMHERRVSGIHFVSNRSAKFIPEREVSRHYFSKSDLIFSDKVSKFAMRTIEETDGLPIQRFTSIFDGLCIDEGQDLAGYDLDLVESLLRTDVDSLIVADHRQATFSTHATPKYKKYAGPNIVSKFKEWEADGLCEIEHHNYSYRCIQAICDFADQFYPDSPDTESKNPNVTQHDGVFAVRRGDIESYMDTYDVQPLRYNRRTKCERGEPLNFGASKGMTFERTLIYPHGPLREFLLTGTLEKAGKEIEKIYVAVTRARQSVAFVVEDDAVPAGLAIFGE